MGHQELDKSALLESIILELTGRKEFSTNLLRKLADSLGIDETGFMSDVEA